MNCPIYDDWQSRIAQRIAELGADLTASDRLELRSRPVESDVAPNSLGVSLNRSLAFPTAKPG